MTATVEQGGLAYRLHRVLAAFAGGESPIGLRLWDGSRYDPPGAYATAVVHSPRAARHVLWQPGELGLARAYVCGDLDLEEDLGSTLEHLLGNGTGRPDAARLPRIGRQVLAAVPSLARAGVLGGPPEPPPEEARPRGRLHSLARDRASIGHHYDLGNEFYELLLDDTMAYSCGYWEQPADRPTRTEGAAASRANLDRICRKLGLEAGTHLVDVGCGWGALTTHAAARFGARVTAVTLSRAQGEYVRERAVREGLQDLVEVRVQDYRALDVQGADAVTSIEMGEHVGRRQYPRFCRILCGALRPGGRLVLQQMSRGRSRPGGGPFIESYIAPDMHMRPLGHTLEALAQAGLEVRGVEAMREHYVSTAAAWSRTLEERWADVVALAGERTARVWRLYLAGGRLAFAQGRMGVDQVLATRPAGPGR